MSMNWDWSNEVEYLNEKLPPDNLDRAKYAKFLYEVAARRGETSNLVININAEWGAGKTHFTRRLAQTIKEKHPTVYVDAWKQDFSDDPLLAIFSSISEQLGDQSDKFTALAKITEKKVGVLLKGVGPALVQGFVKKITGVDDFSEIAKSVTENMIELHKEKNAVIEEIKCDLRDWVRYVKQKDGINKDLPIFIFIDELDRCRPSYAINLLEIVKHIFDVKGLVFFISTDTEQLQHSIKVVYGKDFDAQQYLGRFFDRRNILSAPKTKELLETRTPESLIKDYLSSTKNIVPQPVEFHDFTQTCSDILDAFQINLRDSLKYYDRLCDLILIENKTFDPFYLLIIMYLFDKENSTYKSIKLSNQQITKESNINEHTKISLQKQININVDLSSFKTGVQTLTYKHNSESLRLRNEFKTLSLNSNIYNYINSATKVIKTEKASSIFTIFQTKEEVSWKNGGIENDKSMLSYLKICWTNTKGSQTELKFHEYFDLVELSTTLD